MESETAVLSRPVEARGWFTQPAAVLLGLLIGGALFGVLFPWFPGGAGMRESDASPWTLSAPRDLSYESVVLTEAARSEAADAIDDVHRRDDSIAEVQIAELARQLELIEEARADVLSASARESRIRSATGGELSDEAVTALGEMPDTDFRTLGDEARDILGRLLSGSIAAAGVEATREQAAELLPVSLGEDQRLALTELIAPLIVPTLVVDVARTEQRRQEARDAVPPVRVTRERGQVLVVQGERLSEADIELLDAAGLNPSGVRTTHVLAAGIVSLLSGAACGVYLFVARPRALAGVRRLTLFALLLLVPAAAIKFAFPLVLPDVDRHFLAYALPLAASPIAAVVLLDLGAAVLLTVLLSSIAVFVSIYLPFADAAGTGQLETSRAFLVVCAGSLAGLFVAARANHLGRYLTAGFAAALAAAAALGTVWLIDPDRRPEDLAWIAGAAAIMGVASALIGVGFFVLLSRPFGIITRVELMELAQLSHPLLRRLQDEAPGTFQHSVMVSNMAERAADRVGADSLLVRVGAYYHDVGKLVAPTFFVENSPADVDPHASLDPLQSTRVIQQHVIAGVEIARREGVPLAITQFIPQHHGTRLVEFFYRRAAAEDPEIDPDLFRYPGPKPQSRETAIVMLADSSEATVRASTDRSADRIREIVDTIMRDRLEEQQFDECDISLRDLRIVAESFVATLTAVYHPRVEYPQPTAREIEERGGPRADLPPAGGQLPGRLPYDDETSAEGQDDAGSRPIWASARWRRRRDR